MAKRKLSPKLIEVSLPEDGNFPGWAYTGRVNPKLRTLGDLASGSFTRIVRGLSEVVYAWNFELETDEGLAVPNPADVRAGKVEDWTMLDVCGELTLDLAVEMATALTEKVGEVEKN